MPEDVTVEDVEQLHIDAWKLGIKAVAIYRDNCKVGQPLSTTKKEAIGGDAAPPGSDAEARDRAAADRIAELESALEHERQRKTESVVVGAIRERLPRRRRSNTFAFRVADCEGYVTVGEYEDGRPGEVFIKVSKQGSTLAGIMDAFSISISLGLQHQVPLSTYVRKYSHMKFEPAGITDDAELRIATSLVDYIFRRLALDYLTYDERLELGVLSTDERTQPTLPGVEESATLSSGVIDDELLAEPMVEPAPAPHPGDCRQRRPPWPGPSSGTRRSATAAATSCSGPGPATSARAAGPLAAARSVEPIQGSCVTGHTRPGFDRDSRPGRGTQHPSLAVRAEKPGDLDGRPCARDPVVTRPARVARRRSSPAV